MFRFTQKVLIVSILVLVCLNRPIRSNPADAIRLKFRHIDSTLSMLMLGIETAGNDVKRIETMFSGILFNDSLFYLFLVADTKGDIIIETSRDKNNRIFGTNVSQVSWFTEPFGKNSSIFIDVTRIESKKYLLKSRLLYNSPDKDIDSTALFVALIDLELVFMQLQPFFDNPVALLMRNNVVYESDWIEDASFIYSVPGYDQLSFSVARNSDQEFIRSNGVARAFGWGRHFNPFFWGMVFFGITGIVTLSIGYFTFRRMRNSAFIEIAHSKLAHEEKERIHRMAVSHVYCEIKRRIETHEVQEMERRIRGEVEEEVRRRVKVSQI